MNDIGIAEIVDHYAEIIGTPAVKPIVVGLLTSGTEDHTVPFKVTEEVFGLYQKGPSDTEFHVFEGKGF